ncbi:MAG TPA: hypothetical protein VGY56_19875 [Verrucomicrobiae bacterium]|nr:hypothetical protein [Verrucomicrobiae bacterium]
MEQIMSMAWYNALMLLLVLAALILAYYQFGSRADIRRIQYDLELLRIRHKEFVESVVEAMAVAYEQSRRQLKEVRENLRELQEQAVEGLEKQIKSAREQLDALAQRLEEKAQAAKDVTLKTAQGVERAIGIRVRRFMARASLLRVKAKVTRAGNAARKADFDRADGLLAEAVELLRNVRETLDDDRSYDELLNTVKTALYEATAAVRAHTQNIQPKIEKVLTDADQFVGHLEAEEGQEAKRP